MRTGLLSSMLLLCLGFTAATAHAGETVIYRDGETELEGYWASPASGCKSDADVPVVMIVHQWKGLGAYEKERADKIAALCYHAFAVDMYGKGIRPQSTDEAGAQAGKYKKDTSLARSRMKAALDFVREKVKTESPRVAAMGYCFGGTMALELARSGADLEGAISFHGGLATPDLVTAPGIIRAPILVHNGAADPHVKHEEVDAFMREMDAADADWQLVNYADAVHSFTEKAAGNDPSKGAAYNEKADLRSWSYTVDFLEEIFK